MKFNNRNSSISGRVIVAVVFLMLIILPTVLIADDSEPPVVLAVVNGDSITTKDLDRQFMSVHRQMGDEDKASFDYRKIIEKLVNDRLIIQDALSMGMNSEEDFVEAINDIREDLAMRVFVNETFKPDLEIPEDSILAHFKTYYRKVQIRTIAFETIEEAQNIWHTIEHGASMDSIAKEISLDSRRFKGGLDNLKHWVTIPIVFRNQAYHLSKGKLSKPFKYRGSFMILRVEEKIDHDLAELDSFRRVIDLNLSNDRKAAAWITFIDSLKADYNFDMDYIVLGDIQADSLEIFKGDFLKGSDRVVIKAGDDVTITENDLRRTLSHAAMKAGNEPFSRILEKSLDEITEESLIKLATIKDGFLKHATVNAVVNKREDSLLLQIYLQENVVSQVVFDRDDFKTYYEENQETFREPNNVQLIALQIVDEKKAEEVFDLLMDGADFGYLNKKYGRTDGVHHDPNEWLSVTTFSGKIGESLDSLKTGEISRPFPLSDGWVVFKVKAKQKGRLKTPEEVDPQIRDVMFQRKFSELLSKLLEAISADSEINYYEDRIEQYLSIG